MGGREGGRDGGKNRVYVFTAHFPRNCQKGQFYVST